MNTRSALLTLCTFLLCRAAAADEPPPIDEEVADAIDLSDDQSEQIRDLLDDTRRARIKLYAQMKELELDLRRELDGDDPDQETVVDLVERIGELETRARKQRVLAALKVRELLTERQRETLDDLREHTPEPVVAPTPPRRPRRVVPVGPIPPIPPIPEVLLPEVLVPEMDVHVPEINVNVPEVNVHVPEINVHVPEMRVQMKQKVKVKEKVKVKQKVRVQVTNPDE